MQEFICTDETLDIYSTLQYRLSIQMSLDGFSFSILDTIQDKFVLLQHRPFYLKWSGQLQEELNKIVSDNPILEKQFKSTHIAISTPQVALIPQSFYNTEDQEVLFYQNFPYKTKQKLRESQFQEQELTAIYSIPELMDNFITHQFEEAHVTHHMVPFVTYGLKQFKHKQKCFVFAHEKHLEVFAVTENKLQFYNHFRYKNESDIIYYILSVYKQLNLTPETDELILAGYLKKQSELYQQLKRYIRKIEFLKMDNSHTYSYTFNQIPKHFYSTLISLSECEL
ncbi:DUF3822 family protein [Prolixibacteraceae bacterium JC049]|nr:DUF3822 family protein [Prolixibacteraceae bacterium JC049]